MNGLCRVIDNLCRNRFQDGEGVLSCVSASCHMGGLSWPSRSVAKIGRVSSSTGCVNGTLPKKGNIAGHRPLVGDAPLGPRPGFIWANNTSETSLCYKCPGVYSLQQNECLALHAVSI